MPIHQPLEPEHLLHGDVAHGRNSLWLFAEHHLRKVSVAVVNHLALEGHPLQQIVVGAARNNIAEGVVAPVPIVATLPGCGQAVQGAIEHPPACTHQRFPELVLTLTGRFRQQQDAIGAEAVGRHETTRILCV